MSFWEILAEPLTQQSFQKALIGGSLVAVVCAVIGCFVVLRRMAFLGDGLSHAMLAGVTAGYLVMQVLFGRAAHAPAMLIGSILAALVTVGMIGFISKVSRIKEDAAIGIMYTGVFAFGGILVSVNSDKIHLHLYDFVVGQVMAVKDEELWLMAFVAVVVLSFVILLFRQLQITTFDPVMAASIGIPVLLMHYLLMTCMAFVVVSAVMIVGVVLVVGLLITPAATAYLLCDRLSRMLVAAAGFGLSSVVIGLYLALWQGNWPPGPAIVLTGTVQFLVVLAFAPRYGLVADWLRRRRLVPQTLIEDVLGSLHRAEGQRVSRSTVLAHVAAPAERVQRAIAALARQDLITVEGETLALTAEGSREALRLVRAHRLWEAYLDHVGTPAEELHDRAHQLEHVHDEQAVDYLDDKLGHPLTDPHGSEIPQDFVHLVPGAEVNFSLLREGHRGRITALGERAPASLSVGDEIAAGPRTAEGRMWTLLSAGGESLELDHATADAVTVELLPPADA